jgi:hypothetical protein
MYYYGGTGTISVLSSRSQNYLTYGVAGGTGAQIQDASSTRGDLTVRYALNNPSVTNVSAEVIVVPWYDKQLSLDEAIKSRTMPDPDGNAYDGIFTTSYPWDYSGRSPLIDGDRYNVYVLTRSFNGNMSPVYNLSSPKDFVYHTAY